MPLLRLNEAIRPGVVFLPMHWGASQSEACEANRLMHELGCPLSKQPELKAAAVRLEAGSNGWRRDPPRHGKRHGLSARVNRSRCQQFDGEPQTWRL